MHQFDNPPSLSIHEEVTYATVVPKMGVFNNPLMYKQDEPKNSLQSGGCPAMGIPTAILGHEDPFTPPRLSAGYPLGKPTFAGTRGNGRDAPKAAVSCWRLKGRTANYALKHTTVPATLAGSGQQLATTARRVYSFTIRSDSDSSTSFTGFCQHLRQLADTRRSGVRSCSFLGG